MRSEKQCIRNFRMLASVALLAGCGMSYEASDSADELGADELGVDELSVDEGAGEELGTSEQDLLASCGGDDSNALSAAFAVAVGNELGRWDVNTDFQIINGKIELSATGQLHCGSGCTNIKSLLRLQADASSVIANHYPSTFRSKLTSWYGTQKSKLDGLVQNMLHVDKGIYRVRSVASGKYIVPAYGSTSSGTVLQQSDQYTSTTAAQWRVVLQGSMHQLINVRSGLCMDLTSNSGTAQNLVQRTCSLSSFSQGFRFSQTDNAYAIRTAHLQATEIAYNSTANGAALAQTGFDYNKMNQRFVFEPVGTGAHADLKAIATAVYSMTVQHSGMAIGVSSGSLGDGVSVVQQPYVASDDRFHWYVTPADSSRYQFINRRTGKCLDMADPYNANSAYVQRACSIAESQRFFFTPTGIGPTVPWNWKGVIVGIPNSSTTSGAQLGYAGTLWAPNNYMTLSPVTAGEPHRLTFNRKEAGGPCGDYYWYDVKQPNGIVLDDPASTYVQLIFAGGKQTPTGYDVNPFIAQQVSGSQVAIDPTYGLLSTSGTTSANCTSACLKISTVSVDGQCCSCNGLFKRFAKSLWSSTTYVCQ
jgi:hypothetical protein